MKNRYQKLFVTMSALCMLAFSACDDTVSPSLDIEGDVYITEFSVDGLQAIIDETKNSIVLKVPDGTDVSDLSPSFTLSEGASITPAITANMDFSTPIDVVLVNGNVYNNYTITVTEQFYIGFLGTYPSVSAIEDDDEKAAAEWFFANYDNGVYISFDQIKEGSIDLNDFRVLWWYYDENSEIPAIAQDATVLNSVNDFYKAGGNLLLNSHATAYLWTLGRMTVDYPMAIGNGAGGDNPDVWGIGVKVGTHDMSGHPVYKGIGFNVEADGYKTFPVIAPGWKEDHNHVMLDIPASLGIASNTDEAVYETFKSLHQVEWLGTWSGIRDYWMVGVLEFLPNDTYQGRAIYQGIGGFEFNQNAAGDINPEGLNTKQSYIELFSKNALNYLSLKN